METKENRYDFHISNPTNKRLKFILFGYRMGYYYSENGVALPNCNSDKELVIKFNDGSIPYEEIIEKIAENPFDTSLILITSDSNEQFKNIFILTVIDSRGKSFKKPINPIYYANERTENSITIPYKIFLDGSTSLEIMIEPKTNNTYSFLKNPE